jgi:glucose/arabinose dehydrogenase
VAGSGHFGGRMAFAPDGTLYVTAGERQRGSPAQDLTQTLGKIVRINADGSIPADNPFVSTAGRADRDLVARPPQPLWPRLRFCRPPVGA